MTNVYAPGYSDGYTAPAEEPFIPQLPSYGATSDAFGSARAVTRFLPPQPLRYREYKRRTLDPETGETIVHWEIAVTDLRGSSAYAGSLKAVGHGATPKDSVAPLDRRYPLSLALPPAVYTTTITNGWGDAGPICTCAIFGVVLVAIGSTANECLLKVTPAHSGSGATDHDVATLTYLTLASVAGWPIKGLYAARVGGFTSALRLAILGGTGGNSIQWKSDAANPPTSLGADHANFDGAFWMCESPTGGGTLIVQAGGKIYSRLCSAAIGAAPTDTLTVMNDGGWGGWLRSLKGYPADRIFAVEPDATSSVSVIGTAARTHLIHVAADGTDKEFVSGCPLKTITAAGPWQDELFVSDGKTAYIYDGERWLQINWRDELPGDSTLEGYWPDDRGMYFLVRRWNSGATLYTRAVWFWDAAANTSYLVQIARTDTATILMAAGAMPQIDAGAAAAASLTNGGSILWPVRVTNDMRWQEQWQPPAGYNPYWLSEGRTTPPPAGFAVGFEASASYEGPMVEIEGLEGYEKTTDGIWSHGNINDAGSAATPGYVTVGFGGYSVTFTADGEHDYPKTNYYGPTEGKGRYYQAQLTIDAARTTADENYTPQILPLTIRGRAFLPPVSVEPGAAGVGVYTAYDGSGFLPSGPPPVQRRRK